MATVDVEIQGSGAAFIEGYHETDYATARSTSIGYNSADTHIIVGQVKSGDTYDASRGFLKFDTSIIGADAIVTVAKLRLVVYNDTSDTDFDVEIIKQDWSGQDPLSDGNREAAFDNCLAGTLDVVWRNTSGMELNTQYTSPNLDITRINTTGSTYFSFRSSRDQSASAPSGLENIRIASPSYETVAYRPVLIVTYRSRRALASGRVAATGRIASLGRVPGTREPM